MKRKNLLFTAIASIAFATTSLAQMPSYVPTNGLVGYWGFNGNANDESGNGNNGTVNGATLTTDRNGSTNSAYNFDGTGNYISINDNATLKFSSHTISLWYKRDGNPLTQSAPCPNTGIEYLISKGRDIDNNAFTLAHTNDFGELYYRIINQTLVSSYNIGNWTNIIVSYDSSLETAKLYINGELISIVNNITWNCLTNNSALTFGIHSEFLATTCTYFFKGKLDDIGIWNRALTKCEIGKLYSESNNAFVLNSSQTNVSCYNGNNGFASVTPVTSGTYSYAWSTSPTQTTSSISGLQAGSYTVTVTELTTNSCTSSKSFNISEPSAINSSISSYTNVSCFGLSNGVASVSANGGTGTLSYIWSGGFGTNSSVSGLPANTYTCSVSDQNMCSKITSVTITQPNDIDITTTTNLLTITANQTGATYQWIDCNNSNASITGATSQSYKATVNGSYAVKINVGGCQKTSSCVVINTVGENENKLSDNNEVIVYPNPTTGKIKINTFENSVITITDVFGKEVKKENCNGGLIEMDLSELKTGIYFLKLNGISNQNEYKIIKN